MASAKKRKAADMDIEDIVRKNRESRKRGKREFVTPELLDTKSKPLYFLFEV